MKYLLILTTILGAEWIHFVKRKKLEKIMFDEAITKAYNTGKNLFVYCDVSREDQRVFKHPLLDKVQPVFIYTDEQLRSIVNLSEGVVLELYKLEDLQRLNSPISKVPPENIFSVHHQPWSLSAYVNTNGFPQKLFLLYPPYYKSFCAIRNPIRSRAFYVLCMIIMIWSYFRLPVLQQLLHS